MADADALSAIADMELQFGDSDSSLFADHGQGQASEQDGATSTPAAAGKVNANSSQDQDAVRSLRNSVKFGVNTSMRSGAPIKRQNTGIYRPSSTAAPVATAVVASIDDFGSVSEASTSSIQPLAEVRNSKNRKKNDSILKNAKKRAPAPVKSAPKKTGRRQLTAISAKYDLDGDGVLDEIEQAMRDRDVDGDGQLDNAEVYRIVQDQLKSQTDYKLYKKVAAGLLCLVAILSVSHLGTSMAAVMLSRESVADKDSGTIQTMSGEIIGFQETSHLVDLEELSDDEFDERRRLVDAEMAEDPDHPDHLHRRLAKKKGKGKGDVTKIAYDHGKVKQKDLVEMKRMCNGANTVQMRRKWRGGDIMDNGSYDEDFDILCAPGTVVKEKGKKKNNKNKSKTQVVNELITFERKGRGGQTVSQTFTCPNRGEDCFSSGENLHQREGHPCNIQRDFVGVSECIPGLACYNRNDHFAKKGKGQCTKLQRFARQNQICDVTLEVDACVSEYACYSQKGRTTRVSVGTVSRGICNRVTQLARANEVCDVSFKANACIDGYRCLSKSGRDIGKKGIGFCARSSAGSGGSSGNIAKFAQKDQPCNTKHGFNACAGGYACYSNNGPGGGGTGRCELVRMRESPGGICLKSYEADSCVWGSQCVLSRGASRRANYGECSSIGGNGGNGGGNGNNGRGNGGRGNGVAGGVRGNSGGGCLPNGASFAIDCTNNRSCSGRKTCLKNCTPGSDRWFCY